MQQPLKVLFPTGSFYPAQTGGPDNTVYWIAKALTRRGHQTIISTTDWGQPTTTLANTWIETDYGKAMYAHDLIRYLPVASVKNMLSQISQVDVLHLTMITYPGSFISAILNSLYYKKPMVWSSRGDLDPPMLLRSRKKKAFAFWLIETFVKKDLILFHSTCVEETGYIRDVFGESSRVVEIPNYMELPQKVDVPKQDYILFVGRIDPKKGIENLLEALAASKMFLVSTTKLKIAGDHHNEYGKSLQHLSQSLGLTDKVEFVGHVFGESKEKLLAAATFLVMPSHTENFGIVVTEALAQGTPAIASTGTPWKILEEAKAGLWANNDPASLRTAIERMLSTPAEELEAMGRNAFKLAHDSFNIHNNVDQWEAAYARALTGD